MKFILALLLLLFIFLNKINSQNVDQDIIGITDISNPLVTQKYPMSGSTCYFYRQLKIEFGETCLSPKTSLSVNTSYVSNLLTSDDGLSLIVQVFNVITNVFDVYVDTVFTVNCTNGSFKTFTISNICYLLKESDITINVVKPRIINSELTYYELFLQIDGFKCQYDVLTILNNYAFQFILQENGFVQLFTSRQLNLDFPNNQIYNLTITFPTFNYTFQIESYDYGIANYNITNYKTIPTNLINGSIFDVSTTGDVPSFNFKSNTTLQYPNFFFKSPTSSPSPLLINSNNDGTFNYKSTYPIDLKLKTEFVNYTFYSLKDYDLQSFNSYQFTLNYSDLTFQVLSPLFIAPNLNNIGSISFWSQLNQYNFIIWNIYGNDIETQFPFGFLNGNLSSFNYGSSFLTPVKNNQNKFTIKIKERYTDYNGNFQIPFTPIPETTVPIIKSYNFTKVENNVYIIKVEFKSISGIDRIEMGLRYGIYGIEYLISGDIYNGIMEFVFDVYYGDRITLFDIAGNSKTYNEKYLFSTEYPYYFLLPNEFTRRYNLNEICNITFLYNNIQVSNTSVANRLTFNFTKNVDIYKNAPLLIYIINNVNYKLDMDEQIIYAKWSDQLKLFYSDFIYPIHSRPGVQGFTIIAGALSFLTSRLFSDQLNLNVLSNYTDYYGPIFNNVIKSNDIYADSISTNNGELKQLSLYWILEISDTINGFSNGIVMVRGSIDGSVYNFTLDPTKVISGDKYYGNYKIQIDIELPSIPQSYEIFYVELTDENKFQNIFEIVPLNSRYSVFNPFTNLENTKSLRSIQFNGEVPYIIINDTSPPILTSFNVNSTLIDVGGNSTNDSTLLFEFSAKDIESGLKSNQYPVVYLMNNRFDLLKCQSVILSRNETDAFYSCEIKVPYAFGLSSSSNILLLSVYGFINNGGQFAGFNSMDLNNYGYQYNVSITFTNLKPIIFKTSSISNTGGKLIIYGNCLKNSKLVTVIYSDGQITQSIQLLNQTSNTVVSINGVNPTLLPIYITVTSNDLNSNEIQIVPQIFDFLIPTPTPSPTTTPTTTTPLPSPLPFKCLGTPECGGSLQGYCDLYIKSCVCYSPWIGSDCNGKVIIIPQPTTNTSSPSIIIDTGNKINNSTSNVDELVFKSIISIVSLRELDFQDNQVALYTFDKWIFTSLNKFKNQYQTVLTTNNKQLSDIENQVNVTVTLEWFENKTLIEFANQQLTMNPSSIKYTIELLKYPFQSKLNKLQLVMSASLQVNGNSENVCSTKSFGNTLDSGSENDSLNYIQIQIDDHSLYGRFVKRGIVDSIFQTIDNVLLDSSLNAISSSTLSQSFIGINLPYYSESVIIDPDFSVLLNSDTVSSSQEGSICSNSKSGLSTSQLVGIIVGSVAFAVVIIIGSVYIIHKKYKDKKFTKSMSLKLQSANKNN